jgi:hypothetical protein
MSLKNALNALTDELRRRRSYSYSQDNSDSSGYQDSHVSNHSEEYDNHHNDYYDHHDDYHDGCEDQDHDGVCDAGDYGDSGDNYCD